jgi:hypothetical protein
MTLGSQVTGPELAKRLAVIWLEAEYTPGGRSEPKIRRIEEYEALGFRDPCLEPKPGQSRLPRKDESMHGVE